VAEDAVGADRIVIRPQLVDGITQVMCSHRTIRGRIVSMWTKGKGKPEFLIVIPPDTEATIQLPFEDGGILTESGKPIAEAEGIVVLPPGDLTQNLKIGSGRYYFTVAK
jgi:alpha-L-rhamnosidase